MSTVRVYELAKEAGLDSKTMTTKLIDMGYDVKSHSSTVDEKTADDIRVKLGLIKTKVEEKRIQAKGGPTIIRRRTKAVKEEAPPQPPVAEVRKETVLAAEEVAPAAAPPEEQKAVEKGGAGKARPEEAISPPAVGEAIPGEPVAATQVEEVAPAAEPGQPQAAEAAPGEAGAEEAAAKEGVGAEKVVAAPAGQEGAEQAAEEAKRTVPPGIERPKKGLARVIKKAAIHIPAEKAASAEKTARKAVRPKGPPVAPKTAPAGGFVPAEEEGEKAKKGKRYVKFQPEVAERDRGRKAGMKRKSRIVVDVDEVEELDSALPSSLRVGRTHRGGGKKFKKAPTRQVVAETKAIKKRIKVTEFISVGDIAHRMGVKAGEIIAKLMGLGIMATVNQALDVDTAMLVADEFGYEVEQGVTEEQVIEQLETKESGGKELPRPPVVTVMGHVDHGKTSILDAIRKTDVAAGEAGGITQHIGAHYVRSSKGDVVFLDTPGHEAFTEMRSRGAKITDVVVLVVAADDGVMEQTKEAINHAKAADVPIVVAVNKIDKENADPMRVMRELSDFGLVPEEWGGETIYCQTSAKKNIGIEQLLEQILLQAEMQELKADPNRKARGRVIEAQLHKGRGPIATILVQHGTLRPGDSFVAGQFSGKVRSLFNGHGQQVKEAGPSVPVEVQGLSGVPQAGDEFIVVEDEKMAKNISSERQLRHREVELASSSKISLDNLFEKLKEGEVKELRVLLRADVQGTLEAFGKAIEKLSTDEIRVKILHSGTGTITDSDVLLAAASDAIIIGFNVRPSAKVAEFAKNENVDIRFYDVIYHALEDIEKAMVGMLEPTFKEKVIGNAEVRNTFHVPKIGTIAGCYVTDGKVERNAHLRLLRDGVVIYTGRISSLKRFKDDVREVLAGYECGIGVENFNDIKVGDVLEAFVMEEVAAAL
jgi:translation initiation factor IF-2